MRRKKAAIAAAEIAVVLPSLLQKHGEVHGMVRRKGYPLQPALVSPKKAAKLLEMGAVFIDVREAYEYNARRIDGSRSVPLSAMPTKLENVFGPVVFYCQTGTRTVKAAEELKAIAPSRSVQITGGLDAWIRAGLPVIGGEAANLVGADLLKRLLNSISKANQ